MAAIFGILAMPVSAVAQDGQGTSISASADCDSPTTDQYGGTADALDECVEGGGGSGGSGDGGGGSGSASFSDPVGPLPFTGFDMLAMLLVALAVTGLGLALQRAVSKQPRDLG